jgi:alkylation response protein AidB-like acyl-CoA dehydrogenase
MATRLQAARLLAYGAASASYRGEHCVMAAGTANFRASEAAVKNALEGMSVYGGCGYAMEYQIDRYFRDAPLMCMGEGTKEILCMIIAKPLTKMSPALMLMGEPMGLLAGVRVHAVEQYAADPLASLDMCDMDV